MDFIRLKYVTIIDDWISDTNFTFNWSEKYYHPIVVNIQRPKIILKMTFLSYISQDLSLSFVYQ